MLKVAGGGGGSGSNGTVTQVNTGTGLTGGPISTTGTIAIANTAVTAAAYGSANTVATFTVNSQGQLTSAGNSAINIDVSNVSGAVANTTTISAGTGLSGGGNLASNVTISLANTAVVAGTYSPANITVDAQGRIIAASNVASGGGGTVTSITAGTGLSGGTITTSGTIAIDNTTVTAAAYGGANTVATFTVNAQGQLTAAGNSAINIAVANVTGLGTMATQNASAVVITGGTINSVSFANGTYANANITSVAVAFPNNFLANSSTTLGNATLTLGGTTSTVGNLTLTNVTISSVSTPITAAQGGTGLSNITANNVVLGNATSSVQLVAPGTNGNVLTSNGTTWISSAAGGGAAFPSGTVMLFVQTAAPTGWTKSTTHDNKALRVVSGTASTGGSVAFTTAFAASLSAGSTTLSTAQMPSHTHTTQGAYISCGSAAVFTIGEPGGALSTGSAGSSSSHNHTLPSFAVSYVDVIIATAN